MWAAGDGSTGRVTRGMALLVLCRGLLKLLGKQGLDLSLAGAQRAPEPQRRGVLASGGFMKESTMRGERRQCLL